MQDDDDKVRRNLVVFSAAVLASEFLEVHELGLLSHLFSSSHYKPEPWRLTAFAMLVLLYLLLRYRFSKASFEAIEDMFGDWRRLRNANIVQLLRSGVNAFNLLGLQPGFIDTNLKQAALAEIEDWTKPHPEAGKRMGNIIVTDNAEHAGKVDKVQFTEVSEPHGTNTWRGDCHTGKEFYVGTRLVGRSTGGQGIRFSFGLTSRLIVCAMSTLQMTIYSRSAINFFTPMLLSLLAMGILINRLAWQRQWF